MATSKPISNISYNTVEFLIDKLNYFYEKRIIKTWYFIKHQPEADEGSSHIHLFILPNKVLDPMELSQEFEEFIPGEKLPRRVMRWEPSNFEDWYYYSVHDKWYLETIKNQSREFHYKDSDFFCFDEKQFQQDVRTVRNEGKYITAIVKGSKLRQRIQDPKFNKCDLIYSGEYDLGKSPSILALTKLETLDRNGRFTHTPKQDLENKEGD